MSTCSVVDTPEADACGPVTVADGVGIDVVVAVALLARPHAAAVHVHGVAEVAVLAQFAPTVRIGVIASVNR